MATSFKIPTCLKRMAKKDPELSKLEWKLFGKEKEVGFLYVLVRLPRKIQRKTRKRGYQKE
jgi:hypothetical protein